MHNDGEMCCLYSEENCKTSKSEEKFERGMLWRVGSFRYLKFFLLFLVWRKSLEPIHALYAC